MMISENYATVLLSKKSRHLDKTRGQYTLQQYPCDVGVVDCTIY